MKKWLLIIILALSVILIVMPKIPNVPKIENPITHEVKADPTPDILPLNPDIIMGEFQKVNELVVFKSTASYKDTLRQSNWYSSKTLGIELYYDYGIGIDLSQLHVESLSDDIVSIDIPVSELRITYLSQSTENSKFESSKSIFATQYTPEQVKAIEQQAESSVREAIDTNKDIFAQSLNNLQDNISDIVFRLGFKKCTFKLII